MLTHLLKRPVRLRVGGEPRQVRSPRDLETALAGASAPSAVRIATLAALPAPALAREQQCCAGLALRIEQALARPPGDSQGPAHLLAAVEATEISEDHGWRELLAALATLGADGEAMQRVALRRHLDYLAASRTLIDALQGRQGAADRDTGSGAGCVQRLSFDLRALAGEDAAAPRDEFGRIPKGETLDIDIDVHQSIDLMLARYRFTLVAGSPFVLIDENGADLHLQPGKNIVGRGVQCDVVVDDALRAVSRRHLIVECATGAAVRITDISTLGTFVPRPFLEHRLH